MYHSQNKVKGVRDEICWKVECRVWKESDGDGRMDLS